MRKELYLRFDENQENYQGIHHDIDFNSAIERELIPFKRRNSKISNQTTNLFSDRPKPSETTYLQLMPVRHQTKPRTQRSPQKINTDDLINVLQTGNVRKNVRRNTNHYSFLQKVKMEQTPKARPKFKGAEQTKISLPDINGARRTNSTLTHNVPLEPVDSQLKLRRVIRSMKDDERKQRDSRMKDQSDWREIQSLLANRPRPQPAQPMKEVNKRAHELTAAKQLLTGRVSIIWIFVISQDINAEEKDRIFKMYSGLSDTPYIVPFCNKASQIKTFLSVPESLFKIVADLQNFTEVVKNKSNHKIVQFYVYNNKGEKGIAKALSFKAETSKVKGIFSSLKKIVDRAQQQIQNQVQIFQTKKGFTKKNKGKKFPSFIKLSGEDKTYATLYRSNLYGAKNVLKSELVERYNDFMQLVKEKYGELEDQKQHIHDYQRMSHFSKQLSVSQAQEVVKFYCRESFYYQILNSMLRTMKTTQEFKPCIFPFYETYHSVKKIYNNDLKQKNRKIEAQTLYRGTKLRAKDFNSLRPGVYIEMFGFMSTSKSLDKAKQFCDRDGFIFVINVPSMVIPEKCAKYDHGFVDINKHGLAVKNLASEEQVLFNCLNVFKVTRIQKQGQRHYIYLEYGTIFTLLGKEREKMTSDQKDVLMNYQYCAHLLEEIQDQGDVYLLANQYEQSKQYYQGKLKQDSQEGKYFYKLANVQQQCGQLDEANKNVKTALKIQQQNFDLSDKQKCLKVYSIHSKNAEISLQNQDFLTADQSITQAINLLPEDKQFEKGIKFRQRGQIKFKKGQIIEAEKDFERSETILKNLFTKAEEKKKSIHFKYYFSFLSVICFATTKEAIEKQKEQSLKMVQDFEKDLKNMEDVIEDQLIKVNGSMKEVAHYVQDKEKYQVCVKKARAYLFGVKARQTNDPLEKARLKMLQATIQDYLQLAESQRLLYEAIQLVQSNQPFHPQVGKYSEILANLQKKELEKLSNPKFLPALKLHRGMKPLQFDEDSRKKTYEKCKRNFEKAINVLLYNSRTKNSPEFISLKNQLGQLEFYQSKYEASQQIIKQAKYVQVDGGHSQMARSSLLLSKISYARGQQKNAFEHVDEAMRLLRTALVKKQDSKYIAVFEFHDLHLQIKLHRAKIYIKQFQYDLSLRDLGEIEEAILKKTDNRDYHYLLGDVYENKGENLITFNKDFQRQFDKAIKVREKQIGQYNLANAITYCNLSKFLILVRQFHQAQKALQKALQIFSCFSEDHPVTWLVLYCTGMMNEKKLLYDESIKFIEKSLNRALKKYDKGHISINKIRLQYAKVLQKSCKFEDAIRQFQALQSDLQEQITASQTRSIIQDERDDQKITVKRYLYESLRESYHQRNSIDTSSLNATTLAMDRCQKKIGDLRRTYRMDSSNGSPNEY